MKKLIPSSVVFVCAVFASTLQSNAQNAAPAGTHVSPTAATSQQPKSTTTLSFCSVSSDRRGGVWLSGSAWSLRGLLINDRDGVLVPQLTPGVKEICQSVFTSAERGWMVDARSLWKTNDAGLSWQRVRVGDLPNISTFHFYDSQNGWVGGWTGEIYRTNDGGQTWAKAELPAKYEVQEILFVDRLSGWAVGYSYLPNQTRMTALFRSDDGGFKWQQLSNVDADAKGGVRSLLFLNQRVGWGVGTSRGDIVQTKDGGETWSVKLPGSRSSWNSLFFHDDLHGWAVGTGIAHTSDGGATWTYQLEPESSPGYFESIIFTDAKHGWVVGPNVVMRTTDSGKTWQALPDTWKRLLPSVQTLLNARR